MKSIAFTIVSILSVILTLTNKLYHRNHNAKDPISPTIIVISHIVLLVISITLIRRGQWKKGISDILFVLKKWPLKFIIYFFA